LFTLEMTFHAGGQSWYT